MFKKLYNTFRNYNVSNNMFVNKEKGECIGNVY